jgi:hypothetical protein
MKKYEKMKRNEKNEMKQTNEWRKDKEEMMKNNWEENETWKIESGE